MTKKESKDLIKMAKKEIKEWTAFLEELLNYEKNNPKD